MAVLPPPEIADCCRMLTAMLGVTRPERIEPHITVVPPVNVEHGNFNSVRRHLRAVATGSTPVELYIDGIDSFAPSTPTIHLRVKETAGDGLARIKASLMTGPLERKENHPFRPHLTLLDRATQEQIDSAQSAFSGIMGQREGSHDSTPVGDLVPLGDLSPVGAWQADALHLMEQFRSERGTFWIPVVEEPLAPAVVVGRGGVELVLRTTQMIDLNTAQRLELDRFSRHHDDVLVVTAELPGSVGRHVGVAVGHASGTGAVLESICVVPEHRGMGVARQLSLHWCHAASVRGAVAAVAEPTATDSGRELLGALGFSPVGRLMVRAL